MLGVGVNFGSAAYFCADVSAINGLLCQHEHESLAISCKEIKPGDCSGIVFTCRGNESGRRTLGILSCNLDAEL